jgi:AraC-like DNA-binding protein
MAPAAIEMSARIGAMIVNAAAAAGVPLTELRAATGFDPAVAGDPDARISLQLEERLWLEAARRSGDDDIGLHAAEGLRPGAFDVIDYAIRTAPTLRASLQRLARYNRLEHDVAVFTIIDRGPVTRIEHAFRVAGAVQSRHSAEFTMAAIIVVSGQLLGESVRARAVEFRHAAPPATGEHVRLFGVRPGFGAAVNALEIDSVLVDRPIPDVDPALSRVIERHAEARLLGQPAPAETTAVRVQRLLARDLPAGEVSLSEVAAALHMSARSLQRRLGDEGTSFDAVLDELRHDLALRYLADPKIAIAEVAYLLGFSEPSSFHRAFRRWTGATPREARSARGV